MKIKTVLLLLTCILLKKAYSTDRNVSVAHQLYYDLFVAQKYNPKVRPVLNCDDDTEVYMTMFLKTINSLDGASETFTTSAFLLIEWYDEYLTWNSTNYDEFDFTVFPQDDVWRPDIILYNPIQSYRPLGHKTIMVESNSDGLISWFPMEMFTTSCSVDMTYFPFDIQICELQFMPWSYTTIKLIPGQDTIDTEHYQTNALWDILDSKVETISFHTGSNISILVFEIKLQRKCQHHILTLFLPVLLLTVLNIFATILPISSGERSGFAVTVFLALTVFLTIVDSVMPPNSEKVSLFYVYLMVQATQSTVITILSVVLIRVGSLDDSTQIPWCLTSLERKSRRTCKTRAIAKVDPNVHEMIVTEIDSHADQGERDSNFERTDEQIPCTWMMVAEAIDRLAFAIFSLTLILSTAVFLCNMSLQPK